MKTADELRAILDALPRPLHLISSIQLIGYDEAEHERWYTSTSPEEALFMLQYMAEGKTR
jgi:hypothetical protein